MDNAPTRTIFLTGGHITPALALMDEIRSHHPDWRIVCIGRATALEGSEEESVERRLVTRKGAMFLPLAAGRFSRTLGVSAIVSFLKIPVGLMQAFWYCASWRPTIVVSFGGYVALPVALSAYTLGIPIITHEQTRLAGLANKIIGFVAKKICITFEDQATRFPKGKTVVTGLPMRRELFAPPPSPPFEIDRKPPLLYVTGGSTGAVSMNDRLFPMVERLTREYTVIHQTGSVSFPKAAALRVELPTPQQNRYIVQDFFDTEMVSWILHHAAVIIGRSGANTVTEAAALGKPMICIPLPWSAGGEQLANAQWLVARGLGRILLQKEFTKDRLFPLVKQVIRKERKEQKKPVPAGVVLDGSERMLRVINAILGS